MLQDLLLILNMLVCLALIGVVLLQRSEGGAFGTGGGPTGLVTARGAGDLLTRTTWVLFSLFLVFSLSLTLLGGHDRSSQAFLQRLKNTSVNPDQIAHPAPSPATAPPPAQGAGPASAPGALALPPIANSPAHRARPAPAPSTAPGSLTLPPIDSGSKAPPAQ